MTKSIIILDSNIVSRSPHLDSDDWIVLHAHAEEWQLQFAVPAVVVMETVNVVHRVWRPSYDKLKGLVAWVDQLGRRTEIDAILSAAEARHARYEDELTARLEVCGVEVVPVPSSISHMEIARRASERRAPYVSSGHGHGQDQSTKDGYRDTLIWLTVLSIAERDPSCDVWFVSDNYSDFGTKGDGSKDPRDTQEYPLRWHQQLEQELTARGLIDRVFYARGLHRLEQHLQSKFAPLSDEELAELWESVDQTELDRALVLALFRAEVEPRSAALPLDTLSATVISSIREHDSLRLSEAAHRAAGTWTAQFSCEVEVGLEVTNHRMDVSETSKTLVVSGRVVVAADHRLIGLTIEALEARSDDPMRRSWARADAVGMTAPELRRLSDALAAYGTAPELPSLSDALAAYGTAPELRRLSDALGKLNIAPELPGLSDALAAYGTAPELRRLSDALGKFNIAPELPGLSDALAAYGTAPELRRLSDALGKLNIAPELPGLSDALAAYGTIPELRRLSDALGKFNIAPQALGLSDAFGDGIGISDALGGGQAPRNVDDSIAQLDSEVDADEGGDV
ncbi:PIN domain-containing protein [Aldersonia sp. NBC_00410]|uniref:PIN domain-containing protein n=1 Tax=Aldersonia sp. NBC_00410 TaxID=2975954 RepID=UPI00225329F8|nr:PIN domain-containing protein [Aldersonia sp. NBC_00410]MCX5046254.1 PIN domain-containing protein [Aldersonia sp. NBC_00410]